jgi:hypothetical protein
MTSMTLFGGKTSALAKQLQDNLLDTLSGGSNEGAQNRRISIKGGVFREMINGKEFRVSEERAMNVVIVNAAPVSRMYFAGTYSEGEVVKPMCWSSDTQKPDAAVPQDQKQANRCLDCKQNIKGSGAGEGRACRFQQRLAVQIEGEIEKREVYQLTAPATSVFGEGDKNKMPLQAYGRHLKAHGEAPAGIITEIRFDTASPTPKLIFKPVRALDDAEISVVLEMQKHPDTVKAITLNVSQMDGVIPAGKKEELFEKPVEKAAPKLEAPKAEPKAAAEEAIEEPKKMVKKSAPPADAKADLASLVGDWDD